MVFLPSWKHEEGPESQVQYAKFGKARLALQLWDESALLFKQIERVGGCWLAQNRSRYCILCESIQKRSWQIQTESLYVYIYSYLWARQRPSLLQPLLSLHLLRLNGRLEKNWKRSSQPIFLPQVHTDANPCRQSMWLSNDNILRQRSEVRKNARKERNFHLSQSSSWWEQL